jgi:hypothetical protein
MLDIAPLAVDATTVPSSEVAFAPGAVSASTNALGRRNSSKDPASLVWALMDGAEFMKVVKLGLI